MVEWKKISIIFKIGFVEEGLGVGVWVLYLNILYCYFFVYLYFD